MSDHFRINFQHLRQLGLTADGGPRYAESANTATHDFATSHGARQDGKRKSTKIEQALAERVARLAIFGKIEVGPGFNFLQPTAYHGP